MAVDTEMGVYFENRFHCCDGAGLLDFELGGVAEGPLMHLGVYFENTGSVPRSCFRVRLASVIASP